MDKDDYTALPHSEESERIILGAILLDNSLISKVAELLQPKDFYSELHCEIFRSMRRISGAKKKIEPVIIYEDLKKTAFGEIFSVADITNLTYGLPHFSDVSPYVDILKEYSLRRDAKKVTNNLLINISDTENITELLNQASEKFQKLAVRSNSNCYEKLGFTFGELASLDLPPREEIIFGLRRGSIGLLNAVSNVGKTTLLRNLMVSLCLGKPFLPFGSFNLPKRVALLDFEDSADLLRSDFNKILGKFSFIANAHIKDNALIICDALIDDEELSLSNPHHLYSIKRRLQSFAPDLIIVDTIASAFKIRDENNNAEVRNSITSPLKTLAKDCNAAVLAAHHIGKAKTEEGQIRESSHKGRGASSFADMSRLVLNLERDAVDDTVKLICAKVKGPKFTDLKFKLNTENRWFESLGECREITNYTLLLEMFEDGKVYSTKQIVEEFEDLMSQRLVKSNLNQAVKRNDLKKVRHGHYQNFLAWEKSRTGENAKVQIL